MSKAFRRNIPANPNHFITQAFWGASPPKNQEKPQLKPKSQFTGILSGQKAQFFFCVY